MFRARGRLLPSLFMILRNRVRLIWPIHVDSRSIEVWFEVGICPATSASSVLLGRALHYNRRGTVIRQIVHKAASARGILELAAEAIDQLRKRTFDILRAC